MIMYWFWPSKRKVIKGELSQTEVNQQLSLIE
jgi:hypothetical protein